MKETKKLRIALGVTGCAQAEFTPRFIQKLKKNEAFAHAEMTVVSTEMGLLWFDRKKVETLIGEEIFLEKAIISNR